MMPEPTLNTDFIGFFKFADFDSKSEFIKSQTFFPFVNILTNVSQIGQSADFWRRIAFETAAAVAVTAAMIVALNNIAIMKKMIWLAKK